MIMVSLFFFYSPFVFFHSFDELSSSRQFVRKNLYYYISLQNLHSLTKITQQGELIKRLAKEYDCEGCVK